MDPQVTTTASVRRVIQNLRSTDTIKKLKILKFLQHLFIIFKVLGFIDVYTKGG